MERWMQQLKETYMQMLEGKAVWDEKTGDFVIRTTQSDIDREDPRRYRNPKISFAPPKPDPSLDIILGRKPKPAPAGDGSFGGGKKPAPAGDGSFGGGKPYVKTADYDADGNMIPGTTRDAEPEVDPHIKPLPKPLPFPKKPQPEPKPLPKLNPKLIPKNLPPYGEPDPYLDIQKNQRN